MSRKWHKKQSIRWAKRYTDKEQKGSIKTWHKIKHSPSINETSTNTSIKRSNSQTETTNHSKKKSSNKSKHKQNSVKYTDSSIFQDSLTILEPKSKKQKLEKINHNHGIVMSSKKLKKAIIKNNGVTDIGGNGVAIKTGGNGFFGMQKKKSGVGSDWKIFWWKIFIKIDKGYVCFYPQINEKFLT